MFIFIINCSSSVANCVQCLINNLQINVPKMFVVEMSQILIKQNHGYLAYTAGVKIKDYFHVF